MKELINAETASHILDQLTAASKARIFEGNTQRPFGVQALTIDLSTQRLETDPYMLNFPFRTLYIQSATDTGVTISAKFQTRDSYQSPLTMKQNDVFKADYPMSSVALHWAAQSSKTITLVFFVDAEFTSGSLISVTSGGVSVSNGDSFTHGKVTLGVATATVMLAQSTTRKNGTIQNTSGADIWVGGASVSSAGATIGIRIADGETFEWKNTGALYGYSVLGGDVSYMSEG